LKRLKNIVLWLTFIVFLAGIIATTCYGATDKTVIRFSYWYDPIKVYDRLAQKFEEKNPRVDVVLEHYPKNYIEKILTQLAAGKAPDVIRIMPQMAPDMMRSGVLESLEPYIAEDETFEQGDPLVQGGWASSTYKGKRYGIPSFFATVIFYYNTDLFKEAGLKTPYEYFTEGNWTWNVMVDLAKKLTKTDAKGKITQYGFRMPCNWWGVFFPDLWMNGAAFLGENEGTDYSRCTLNTPEAKEVFQSYIDLVHKEKVMPNPLYLGGEVPLGFETGKFAMNWDGDWWIGPFAQNKKLHWDVVPLPRRKEKRYAPFFLDAQYLNAASKHKDLAWKLLRFISLSEEGQILVAKSGLRAPSLRKLWEPENQKLWLNPDIYPEHYIPMMNETIAHSKVPPYRTKWNEIEQQGLNPTIEQMFLLNISVDKALEKIQECINRILQRA